LNVLQSYTRDFQNNAAHLQSHERMETAEFSHRKKAGRREYVRVRLSPGPGRALRAQIRG
jgi:hypothetical protein